MKTRILLLISLLSVQPALAQTLHCDPTKTISDCFAVFSPKTTGDQASKATSTSANEFAQKILSEANTGISTVSSPTQSTKKDFLSFLSAFLDIPSEKGDSKPLTLDYNVPIKLFGGGEKRLKLQAVLAKPDLSDEVTKRLTGNDAAVTALKKDLSQLDDATISASLSPSTRSVGRSIVPHRNVYEALLSPLMQDPSGAKADLALQDLLDEKHITDDQTGLPINQLGLDISVVEAAARGAALRGAIDFANAFGVLLNNQPQFYGSAIYHSRKDLAGFDERSVRVAYEVGFHNLNEFYAQHKNCSDAGLLQRKEAAAACVGDLTAFAQTSKVDADAANRWSAAVEYKATSAWNVVLPQYSINFSAPRAHTFIYSIGYGRNVGTQGGRFDAAVNYEDSTISHASDNVVLNFPERPRTSNADASSTTPVRDRFVATLTYTQKITEKMSLPVSLIYANHASFLGDVNRKLNAHFGISYKLPGTK